MAINQGFKRNDGALYVYQENTDTASISVSMGMANASSLWTMNLSTSANAEPGIGFQPIAINPSTGNIVFTPGGGGSVQVVGTLTVSGGIAFTSDILTLNTAVSAVANSLIFEKDRAGAVIVTGDDLGQIYFKGFDGTDYVTAASVRSDSSGTIAANRVAGSLIFATHPDSASGLTPTDRMTIAPTGAVTVATPDSGTGLTVSGGGLAATGTTTINTTGAATTSIGSTTGASGITFLVGTGNYSLDGVTNSTYTVGASTTTGTITIGGTAQTGTMTLGSSSGTNIVAIGAGEGATTVNIANGTTNAKTVAIGTGAAMANTITLGGTGANVITIGNTQTAGSISLGAAMTTGTISIGGTGAQTGQVDLAPGTGAQTVTLGNGGTAAKTINIGNGIVGNTISIGNGANTSAQIINIANGATAANSTVNILTGAGTAGTQTFNVLASGATRAGAINLGTGAAAHVVSIGTGGTGAVNIGNTTGNTAVTGALSTTTTLTAGTNLLLPTTSSTAGQIQINSVRFFHGFGTNNVFVGPTAGNFTLTTGSAQDTTGIGQNVLSAVTTGTANTALGSSSLQQVAGGDGNTGLGYASGTNYTTTDSHNIAINAQGTTGDSHVMRIGRGTGTGFHQLNKAFISGIRGITTVNADAVAVLIDSAGQLGTVSSSIRFKENVFDMSDDSSPVMNLRPVTFNYKTQPDKKQYGLIAEEVLPIMPDLVVYNQEGEVESVKYQDLPALLLNELQKACERIKRLEDRINKG